MVVWSDSWLERQDANNVKLKLWLKKIDNTSAICNLCGTTLLFNSQGVHAFIQHSKKAKHRTVSDLRFSKSVNHISVSSSSGALSVEPSIVDKITAAELKWCFKVAECDYSLRSCDDTPLLFCGMFDDSKIASGFKLSRTKASYTFSDGLKPCLSKRLASDISSSSAAFTLLFDETTTLQNCRQLDILCRYWSEEKKEVQVCYLTSFIFGRTSSTELTKKILSLLEDPIFKCMPWDRFFNISCDGPNINKALWNKLDCEIRQRGFKGLLPFMPCSLHIVHNGFHKGIVNFGQDAQQLAFDLHWWFKSSPCKVEDYKELADDSNIEEKSLFLRHVESRWLTLAKSLERVEQHWPQAKKYFLEELPKKKGVLKSLRSNKRYMRIVRALRDFEGETLAQIKFLLGISPVFSEYLTIFQSEQPMAHMLFPKMCDLLMTIMQRFMQPSVMRVDGSEDLVELDVTKSNLQLPLMDIDFGHDVITHLNSITSDFKRNELRHAMKEALVQMSAYLQKKLPLRSQLLKDLTCLSASSLKEETSVNAIGRLAAALPHIIKDREVSLVKDEWKLLQVSTSNSSEARNDDSSSNRLDHFWSKTVSEAEGETKKFLHLEKVLKSFLCLQSGNASVERSLSDNKNTVSAERTNLGLETLKGLRLSKDYARREGGAHNVNTLSTDMIVSARNAHKCYVERKKEEEKEKQLLLEKKAQKENEDLIAKEAIATAEKSGKALDQKEKQLEEEEESLDAECKLAEKLLEEASRNLRTAIEGGDIVAIKMANEMVEAAKSKLSNVSQKRHNQRKQRTNLKKKRKLALDTLMKAAKKSKC